MPDIIIGTKNHASLEETYSTMLHELSHATHYFGLGANGKELWIREYYDMLSGWGKMIAEGKSPFEDCYNNGGTDLIKLIESWGYFSGNYLMYEKYGLSFYKDRLEERLIGETTENGENHLKYFYYGGFYDLIDTINEENIDFCEEYTYSDIYSALTTSGVGELNSFSEALVENTNRQSEVENVKKTLKQNYDRD